jgi:predicted ATPase
MKSGTRAIEGLVRKKPVSLKLGFSGKDYGYAIDLGLPIHPTTSLFALDPVIKTESLWLGEDLKRSSLLAERRGPSTRIRQENGTWREVMMDKLSSFDSMMTHCADPTEAAELLYLRERMRNWRFYDQLRTDRDAPARRPQIGTYTPVLAGDGADFAAAIQAILEIGDERALRVPACMWTQGAVISSF